MTFKELIQFIKSLPKDRDGKIMLALFIAVAILYLRVIFLWFIK